MKRIILSTITILICTTSLYGQRPVIMPDIPTWAKQARWYYINVPLYKNGDESNDPKDGTSLSMDWPDLGIDNEYAYPPTSRSKKNEVGDLAGIVEKLPYLKKLGVNTLLLSPIFTRGHDGSSDLLPLRHVDPSVGKINQSSHDKDNKGKAPFAFSSSDKLLLSLITKAHQLNMRIVLEIDCLDRANPAGDGESQVEELANLMAKWIDPNKDRNPQDGIDGLAFRNIRTLSTTVWFHWFIKMKLANINLLTMGPGQERLFDTQINFHMGNAITHFFRPDNKIYTAKLFLEDLVTAKKRYGSRSMENTLVPISSSRQGRARSFYQSIIKGQKPVVADDYRRLAMIFQFFNSGAPLVYYGDEVGMTESSSRTLTKAMWWEDTSASKQSKGVRQGEFYALHKLLNMLRKEYEPIVNGDLSMALDDSKNKVLAISRSLDTEKIVLVINYGSKKQRVTLTSIHPNQKMAILTPQIKAAETNPFTRGPNDRRNLSEIPQFRLSGEQKVSGADGKLSFWVNPMSIRILLDVDAKK